MTFRFMIRMKQPRKHCSCICRGRGQQFLQQAIWIITLIKILQAWRHILIIQRASKVLISLFSKPTVRVRVLFSAWNITLHNSVASLIPLEQMQVLFLYLKPTWKASWTLSLHTALQESTVCWLVVMEADGLQEGVMQQCRVLQAVLSVVQSRLHNTISAIFGMPLHNLGWKRWDLYVLTTATWPT